MLLDGGNICCGSLGSGSWSSYTTNAITSKFQVYQEEYAVAKTSSMTSLGLSGLNTRVAGC